MREIRRLLEACGVQFGLSNGGNFMHAYWKNAPGGEVLFVTYNPPDVGPRGYYEIVKNTRGYRAFDPTIWRETLPLDSVPFGFVERVATDIDTMLKEGRQE